jgi:hypothetical protein
MSGNILQLKVLPKTEFGASIGSETRKLQVLVETQLSRFGMSPFSTYIPNSYQFWWLFGVRVQKFIRFPAACIETIPYIP